MKNEIDLFGVDACREYDEMIRAEEAELEQNENECDLIDRLTEENAKLRELLSDIMECVNQDLWDTRCDDAKQLLNQLRDQNNDK